MFTLDGKSALVTGASGGIGGAIARALHQRRRARARWPARGAMRSMRWPPTLGDGAPRRHRRSRRSRERRCAGQGGGSGARPARHPRQQCRAHPRRARPAHEGRGLADGDRRRSHRRLPPRARRVARHDAPALGPDRHHHLGRGLDRQSRPGELCRRQGRARRHVEGAGGRGRLARHHRQLRRARLHRDRDDRGARRPSSASGWRAPFPWAGSARPRRSLRAWCFWPARRRAMSPATRCTSMAGWR